MAACSMAPFPDQEMDASLAALQVEWAPTWWHYQRLDKRLAMDDVVQTMEASERRARRWMSKCAAANSLPGSVDATSPRDDQTPSPSQMRSWTFRYMERMTVQLGLDRSQFYNALMYFDLYCSSAPIDVSDKVMPALLAASLAVVHKRERVDLPPFVKMGNLSLVELITEFADWLRVPRPSLDDLAEAESKILKTIRFVTNIPTPESWLSIYVKRLSVFSDGRLAGVLQQLDPSKQCMLGEQLRNLMHAQSSTQFPPRQLAIGLLGHALFFLGVLPAEALQGSNEDTQVWDRLLALPGFAPQECKTSPDDVLMLLAILKTSVNQSLQKVQEACRVVAGLYVDAALRYQLAESSKAPDAKPVQSGVHETAV